MYFSVRLHQIGIMNKIIFFLMVVLAFSLPLGCGDKGRERLTSHVTREINPSWSPDGQTVVFVSARERFYDIWTVDVRDKRKLEKLTATTARESYPQFSPDGTKISYAAGDRTGFKQIWVMEADGSNKKPLTSSLTLKDSPTWHPDGKRIAFIQYGFETGDMYCLDLNGDKMVVLTKGMKGFKMHPSWSPDGKKIAFVTLSHEERKSDIWLLDFENLQTTQLSSGPGTKNKPSWSPDGKKIAFVNDASGYQNIWVMDNNGGNVKQLTNKKRDIHDVAWSPTGDNIAYVIELPGENSDIYLLNLKDIL